MDIARLSTVVSLTVTALHAFWPHMTAHCPETPVYTWSIKQV